MYIYKKKYFYFFCVIDNNYQSSCWWLSDPSKTEFFHLKSLYLSKQNILRPKVPSLFLKYIYKIKYKIQKKKTLFLLFIYF